MMDVSMSWIVLLAGAGVLLVGILALVIVFAAIFSRGRQ
ncbi:hypothetical protein HOV93_17720 [Planctomycetes bacterium FF15]|uniref:Uncharacterized protein n=1 Tax=Bremerella alba TaxID=980252 RepID=A0A7V9A749_9BACT|nr:hypothetical protein [Bremerella alba]